MNKMAKKKNLIIIFLLMIILFISYIIYQKREYEQNYNQALESISKNTFDSYASAKEILISLGNYRDAYIRINQISDTMATYTYIQKLLSEKKYESAINMLKMIEYFDDSSFLLKKTMYDYALELDSDNQFNKAYQYYIELGDYEDSPQKAKEALLNSINEKKEQIYQNAIVNKDKGNYSDALDYLNQIIDYTNIRPDIPKLIQECELELEKKKKYEKAIEYEENELFLEAYELFIELDEYEHSIDHARKCRLQLAPQNIATTISAGIQHSTVLDNNGIAICTDDRYQLKNWNNIISVSGLGTMIIGLTKDGKVKVDGQPPIGAATFDDVVSIDVEQWNINNTFIQVASGEQFVAALTSNNKVLIKGLNDYNQTDAQNWKNIISIATGWRHIVGLDSNGEVHIAGYNAEEQLKKINKNKENWDNIIAISAGGGNNEEYNGKIIGNGHTVALREDKKVFAVGNNKYNQCEVEDWSDIIAISAGDWHTVGLKKDGTVVSTIPDTSTPGALYTDDGLYIGACYVNSEEWTDIVAISAGCGTTIGLKKDGKIITAGFNDCNQCSNAKDWSNIRIYKEWDSYIKNNAIQ